MPIEREIAPLIKQALLQYPIVAIIGPRQAGKTTLGKMIVPHYKYVNLEDLTQRDFAQNDPKGFLETYRNGVIIDEIQYAPDLFSYLQVFTDERGQNGEYIITGSQNFLMLERISQSLAGRVNIFNLLPFSISELKSGNFHTENWEDYAFQGFYPRKWTNSIEPGIFFGNYVKTYVERDVRLIKNIINLDMFQKFLYLLAGRTGQLFNQSSLGAELGLDNKTIHSWMDLLELSFIAFRLKPYHQNFNKQIIKTPKVYFYDTGLLCYLLGIYNLNDLQIHFAKGQIFENLIIVEKLKKNLNLNLYEKHFFWRDRAGNEIDLMVERGQELQAYEIKSGKTIHPDFFKSLNQFKKIKPDVSLNLVYGGKTSQTRSDFSVLSYEHI